MADRGSHKGARRSWYRMKLGAKWGDWEKEYESNAKRTIAERNQEGG